VVSSNCCRRRTLSYRTDIVPYDIILFFYRAVLIVLYRIISYFIVLDRTHRTHRTYLSYRTCRTHRTAIFSARNLFIFALVNALFQKNKFKLCNYLLKTILSKNNIYVR